MMSLSKIQELARLNQTEPRNVLREYTQHSFLSALYLMPGSDKLLFKGGTALRLIYGSPRFSEDIDFTGLNISPSNIESLFISSLSQLTTAGFNIDLSEAKKTTGGYLGIIAYQAYHLEDQIKFEISLRGNRQRGDVVTIVNNFIPAYTLAQLNPAHIVKEKIQALLIRQKPRDFYDLYFILRHPELHQFLSKNKLAQLKKVATNTKLNFRAELGVLLPKSHHLVLKNFKKNLLRELTKYA